MALLVFPPNPYNGEIFPVNPPAGVNVYQWDSPDQTWRLLGTATGVVPGIYGSPTQIPVFEVDVVGRLVEASQVPIAVATTTSTGVVQVGANLEITGTGILSVPFASDTQAGVVQLTDSSTDCSPNKALSGVVGCHLQDEIDALNAKTYLTFAGTVNATTGRMTTITAKGAAAGFTVGGLMVTPSPSNIEYLVIVSQPGTFAPPNSLTYNCTVGDWLVSNGLQWIFYNVGPEAAVLVQLDDISGAFDDTQQVFPLTLGGASYTPTSQSNILVSLGGVLQMPGTAFTISGSNIDFADPPLTGTTFLAYVISGATGGGGGGGGGTGTVTSVGTGLGLTGGPITTTGTISLKVATPLSLGGVIPDGTTITVSPSGVISAAPISGANLQQITNNGSITTNSITTGGLISNGSVTLGSSPINLLNVVARVSSNFIPSANQTYDLGSATNRWRDLYVSSNSIYMGANQLTVSGGQLFLNGAPIGGSGTVTSINTGTGLLGGPINTSGTITADVPFFDARYLPSKSPFVVGTDSSGSGLNALVFGQGNRIIFDTDGTNTNSIGLQGPPSIPTTTNYVLPVDGSAGQVLTTNGAGILSWTTVGGGTVGTLQQVTAVGNTTNLPMRFYDAVSTNEAVRIEPDTGLISIFPQALGDPGLYLSPQGAYLGNSIGTFSAAGLVPGELKFNGSAGAALKTYDPTYPVQLWAGGTNLIGSPQLSVTGAATTLTNQLIASSLKYPTTDGAAGEVMTTDGAGNLGWLATAEVVAVPGSSGAGGSAGQIAFGNGFFYWFDTASGQWLRVAGNTF